MYRCESIIGSCVRVCRCVCRRVAMEMGSYEYFLGDYLLGTVKFIAI